MALENDLFSGRGATVTIPVAVLSDEATGQEIEILETYSTAFSSDIEEGFDDYETTDNPSVSHEVHQQNVESM